MRPETSWAGSASLTCRYLEPGGGKPRGAKSRAKLSPPSGKASSEASYSVSALPWEIAYASVWEDAAVQAPEQWLFLPGDFGSSNVLSIC